MDTNERLAIAAKRREEGYNCCQAVMLGCGDCRLQCGKARGRIKITIHRNNIALRIRLRRIMTSCAKEEGYPRAYRRQGDVPPAQDENRDRACRRTDKA